MYDVVIIGAGPAGTAAGYRLGRAGKRVAILDRRQFPRKKACAGGITPKAMSLFPYDISHLVQRTCRRVKITCPGGDSFLVKDKNPLCYMVQRKDLDHFSLKKTTALGVSFKRIDKLLGIKQWASPGCVKLSVLENGREKSLSARFVIGADGVNSRVRSLLEQDPEALSVPGGFCSCFKVRKYPALEADIRVARPWAYPMEFDFSLEIQGYYWVFPRHDHINIGIYSACPDFSPNHKLLADYAQCRFGTHRLEGVKGYPIGVRRIGAGILGGAGQGRVLLAGDAAGLADPLLGEGIYAALASGKLAAEAVGHALEGIRTNALARYDRSLAGLRLDLGLYQLAAGAMYRFPRACLALARRPLMIRPFSKGYAAGLPINQILFPFKR